MPSTNVHNWKVPLSNECSGRLSNNIAVLLALDFKRILITRPSKQFFFSGGNKSVATRRVNAALRCLLHASQSTLHGNTALKSKLCLQLSLCGDATQQCCCRIQWRLTRIHLPQVPSTIGRQNVKRCVYFLKGMN